MFRFCYFSRTIILSTSFATSQTASGLRSECAPNEGDDVCLPDFRLGEVEFDDKVATLLAPTPQLDLFECRVDDLQPRGMTAIFSAVAQATELLAPCARSR